MKWKIEMIVDIQKYYKTIDEAIARQIEGETVIVPLVSGIGDLDAEIFSLNSTGTVVWEKLNGAVTLNDVIMNISKDYDIPYDQIKEDITNLVEKLLKKGLIIEM